MAKEKKYLVLQDFTLDKKYYVGQTIILIEDKVTKKLLINKLIK